MRKQPFFFFVSFLDNVLACPDEVRVPLAVDGHTFICTFVRGNSIIATARSYIYRQRIGTSDGDKSIDIAASLAESAWELFSDGGCSDLDVATSFDILQVGANTGEAIVPNTVEGAVIEWLKSRAPAKTTALLLEPHRHAFSSLVANLNHSGATLFFAQAAINLENGIAHLYIPEPSQSEFSPLSSLIKTHVDEHISRMSTWYDVLKSKERESHQIMAVPSFDWRTLMDVYSIKSVGHLIIDAEGMDCSLLLAFPFHLVRPQLVSFEHSHCDGPFSDERGPRPIFERAVAVLGAHGYVELLSYEGSHVLLSNNIDAHYALLD